MTDSAGFADYYEILEVSPNANSGTIERMFRYFAQRYHPDNPETGDRNRFDLIVEAHTTLKDPVKRAQYDVTHKRNANVRFKLAEQASDRGGLERDIEIQRKLLAVLYTKRRTNFKNPGIGEIELELLLDCPAEYLEFHLWYLKEKGWIKRNENGTLAITVDGIDRVNADHMADRTQTLMIEQRHSA